MAGTSRLAREGEGGTVLDGRASMGWHVAGWKRMGCVGGRLADGVGR